MPQNLIQLFLDKESGELVASNAAQGNNNNNPNANPGYEHIQLAPISTWIIPHNANTKKLICQIYDGNDFLILPNHVQIMDADTVIVTFLTPMSGSAKIIFF